MGLWDLMLRRQTGAIDMLESSKLVPEGNETNYSLRRPDEGRDALHRDHLEGNYHYQKPKSRMDWITLNLPHQGSCYLTCITMLLEPGVCDWLLGIFNKFAL